MHRSLKTIALAAGFLSIGCGSSDIDFNANPPVPQPPVAVNDAFSVLGNGNLQITAPGVLANDTPNGATPILQTGPTLGSLTLNGDGSFTYTPNNGVANQTDTFTYRLNNNFGTSSATVTLQIGAIGAFVNNAAAPGGDGSELNPFQSLAQAVAANGANPVTFVLFKGNGTYNESLTLQANQALQSRVANDPATLSGQVTLTNNNAVRNLRIVATTTAINATNAADGEISGVTINDTTLAGVYLGNATGSWIVEDSFFDNNTGPTINASSEMNSMNVTVRRSTFARNGTVGVGGNITVTSSQNLTVENCSFDQGQAGNEEMVALANGTGSLGLALTNNTVTGGGTALRGISILTQGTSQLTARILNNTISGCTNEGLFALISGNSVAKMRSEGNRTTGNAANNGWTNASSGTATLHAVYRINTSDRFNLNRGAGTIFQVEELADFNTTAGNTGFLSAVGGVQDVPAGSLNIP